MEQIKAQPKNYISSRNLAYSDYYFIAVLGCNTKPHTQTTNTHTHTHTIFSVCTILYTKPVLKEKTVSSKNDKTLEDTKIR